MTHCMPQPSTGKASCDCDIELRSNDLVKNVINVI